MSSGSGQRLYFGNLDPQMTQQELEREVNRFGVTKSVWVAKNPAGFAFVEYVELGDAEECLQQLNGVRFGEKQVRQRPHARAPLLDWYLSPLSMSPAPQVKIEFAKNKGTSQLTPGLSPVLAKSAAVSAETLAAQPIEAAGSEGPSKVKHRAFLKNLPASFSWKELKDEMRRIGDIIYADLDDNGDGVVEFATLADLEYAVRRLDGSHLDGQVISVFKENRGGVAAAAPMSAAAPPPPPPPAPLAPLMPPQHMPSREYSEPPRPRHNGGYDSYDERGREHRRDEEFERGRGGHDARGYGGGAERYDERGGHGGGCGYAHDDRERYDDKERERDFDRGPRSHRADRYEEAEEDYERHHRRRDDYHDDRRDRRRW